MPVTSYSTTPGSNNSAAPNGAPEGWAPSAVNDTIRQIMTDIAVEAQKNAVKVLASVAGTNTVTGSMTPDLTAYSAGMLVVLTPANNNTGATTLNIDSLGARDVQKFDGEALIAGDLVAGVPALLLLDSGADDFILLNPQSPQASSTSAADFGFKGLPQNEQSGDYTCVLADAGKHIHAATGVSTITIPANASVAYPLGTVLTIVNRAGGDISIAITTDQMILAGTSTTGTRTLASNGIATAMKTVTTGWVISGAGLS
jgi:hypothetical protein